jgi:putative DNA primase/helicase
MNRAQFFEELLQGTTGKVELRRMKWNPRKNDKGGYDMLERLFSRDLAELEDFAHNGGGDIFHGVNLRDDSGFARKANICEIVCAQADIDFKDTPKETVDEALAVCICEPSVLVTSGNGYQAYWLLDLPLLATAENIALIENINRGLAEQFHGDFTHDVTRILRTPGRKNSKYTGKRMCEILRAAGPRYSIEDLKQFAVKSANGARAKVEIGDAAGELPKRFEKMLARHGLIQKTWRGARPDLKDQSRSGYDMAMADLLAAHKFKPEDAALILRQMPSGKGADASLAYLEHTIGKAFAGTGEDSETEKADADVEVVQNLTDLGNAKRFEVQHRGTVLYSAERRKWVFWNGSFWQWDITGKIIDLAEDVLRAIYSEAAEAKEKDLRQALAKHAAKTESRRQIEAMLALAQSRPEIRTGLKIFDCDPYLFNAGNSTIDLRTGKARGFRREDYLTRISPTFYDPEAKCPRFSAFLDMVTVGRPDLVQFIQRAAGYSMTGNTREQCIFIPHGSGGNGKSTLMVTLAGVWGTNYAQQIKAEILCQARYDNSAEYHIAELNGMRVALACETERRRTLASALIKQWTGGEPIVGRRPYEMPIRFTPIAKLWFSTNHLPKIDDTTESIWRRIYPIPFDALFKDGNRQEGYEEKLLPEASGVLNWMIEGCLAWQRQKLDAPKVVRQMARQYRAEEDLVCNFIQDECIVDPDESVAFKDLYSAYASWCKDKGELPETATSFGRALAERGFNSVRSQTTRSRKGLRLKEYAE